VGNRNSVQSEVEQIVRTSEILAVARALQAGNNLRIGQTVDYFIEPCGVAKKTGKPYRVPIEQWHLDAAKQMVEQWRSRR
jgi:hypothetical protein